MLSKFVISSHFSPEACTQNRGSCITARMIHDQLQADKTSKCLDSPHLL